MGSELRCLASNERGLQNSQDDTVSPPHIVLLYTQEWLSAVSRVQKEEKERISKFVFSRDAKLALVRDEEGGGGGVGQGYSSSKPASQGLQVNII